MRTSLAIQIVVLLAWGVLAAACSTDDDPAQTQDTGSPQDITATDDQVAADAAPGEYPPGPYGVEVGDTLANHTFYDPAAGAEIELASLYQHPDKSLLLITSGAGWCAACKQEAVELKTKYETYSSQGLEIWSTLFQDFAGDTADEGFWNQWNAQFEPSYPLLLDADFVLGAYFDPESAPMNMLVRLDTMEIIYLETGFDPDKVEAVIKQEL